MNTEHYISSLGKTWMFDLDGTLVKHNGYLLDGEDTWLGGALEFLNAIPEEDTIIFLTSRTEKEKTFTEAFLKKHQVRYDTIIYNLPYGERILVNDKKPSGLITAIAVNTERDFFMQDTFLVNQDL